MPHLLAVSLLVSFISGCDLQTIEIGPNSCHRVHNPTDCENLSKTSSIRCDWNQVLGSCEYKNLTPPPAGTPPVTIAVATYDKRYPYHRYLYQSFKEQDYAGELTLEIYDNGDIASPFFSKLNDPNVTYKHTTSTPAELTLGAKRNWLARNAPGEILVVWDDDDFYGAGYVSYMISELQHHKASLVRSERWLMSHFDGAGTNLQYHVVNPIGAEHGWGFAFVFVKEVIDYCQYADANRIEEDILGKCVDDHQELRFKSIKFDPNQNKPGMVKFESWTPSKATSKGHRWSETFDLFYGSAGTRKPSDAMTQNTLFKHFRKQEDLLRSYIDLYHKAR